MKDLIAAGVATLPVALGLNRRQSILVLAIHLDTIVRGCGGASKK
jgi:hypothetical protein